MVNGVTVGYCTHQLGQNTDHSVANRNGVARSFVSAYNSFVGRIGAAAVHAVHAVERCFSVMITLRSANPSQPTGATMSGRDRVVMGRVCPPRYDSGASQLPNHSLVGRGLPPPNYNDGHVAMGVEYPPSYNSLFGGTK